MPTFVGIHSTFNVLWNVFYTEKMNKLATRGSFSVKIVSYGVLEEDSFILYRFFIIEETKFVIFIATAPPKKKRIAVSTKIG